MRKIIRIVIFSFLGIIIIGTFVFLWKKSQPKELFYEIEEVKQGDIEKKTVVTGKIEPRFEVAIKPQISGIITELRKIAGDNVEAGEVIAVVKVIPEVGMLNSAESQLNMANINLENETQTYNRQKKLHDSGVISDYEFQTNSNSYKRAQEEVSNAREALQIIKAGISEKYASYSNTQVRSTISGTILDIPVKVGSSVIQTNNFNEGTTIASIANMKDMLFIGTIDETEVGKLKETMPITLKIGAIQNYEFSAILEYISPKGSSNGGAIVFEIKASANIPDSIQIRSGYSANADIVLEQSLNAIIVPERCVEFKNDTTYVYIVKTEKPKQDFERQQIKIGLSDGINIEILEGLKTGDRIRGAISNPKK